MTSASIIANDCGKPILSLYQSFSTHSSPVDDDSEGYDWLQQSKEEGDVQIFPDNFTEKYAITGQISEGTYGSIYGGVEKSSGERVVIKVVFPTSDFSIADIINEVFVLEKVMSLKCQQLLKMLNFFMFDTHALIITELFGNEWNPYNHEIESLDHYIKPEAWSLIESEEVCGNDLFAAIHILNLPEDRILNIFTQIATGVAALHKAGIVHRDLKLEVSN
jgi:serine/threonine protein kinase